MYSFFEMHVVNFHRGLSPFKSVFIRELHTSWHDLEAMVNQSLFRKILIVSLSYKDLVRESRYLFLWSIRLLTFTLIIKIWGIQICLIICILDWEDWFFAWSPLKIWGAPAVLRAVWLANTLKPCIKRSEMEFHRMVRGRVELERIKVLNYSSLPSGSDTLLSSFSSSKYLNMNHVMLLSS